MALRDGSKKRHQSKEMSHSIKYRYIYIQGMKTHRPNTSASHDAAESVRRGHVDNKRIPKVEAWAADIPHGKSIPSIFRSAHSTDVFTVADLDMASEDYSKALSAPSVIGTTKYVNKLEDFEKEYPEAHNEVLSEDTSKAQKYLGVLDKSLFYLKLVTKARYFSWARPWQVKIGDLQSEYPKSVALVDYVNTATNELYKKPRVSGGSSSDTSEWLELVQTMLEMYDEAHDD